LEHQSSTSFACANGRRRCCHASANTAQKAIYLLLVVIDEPTTTHDVVARQEVRSRIAALERDLDTSIFFFTHDAHRRTPRGRARGQRFIRRPNAGPYGVGGLSNLWLELKESRGITFWSITPELASAGYIANRAMVVYAGQTVKFGSSDDISRESRHPYTNASARR